jgi:putative MATE family efflux protein
MSLKGSTSFWNARFFKEFFSLSIPIILSNLMGSSLHIIDNIMVGSLGEVPLASVAQANQLAFIMRLTLFGVASGCAIFSSQHWGNDDVPGVRRTMGLSLITAEAVCVLAALAAVLIPNLVMSAYTPDPEVNAMGGDYLRIVGPSYIVIGISTVYNAANRSTERVKVNMVASVASIATNTFLNWCLIFGNLGFPRMEVRGAALATAIAAFVEAIILVGWSYLKRYPSAAKLAELRPTSWAFVKGYCKVAIPVMLNECLWSMGTSAYNAVYGRMSTQSVAAMNVFGTVDQMVMAAVWGAMNAAAVMVGKRIGAGEEEEAVRSAKRMLVMAVAVALLLGGILILVRGHAVQLFNISDEAKAAATGVMLMSAVTLSLRAFNSVNIVGVLRAGGDAVFSMLLDGGAIWLVGVPLAYVSGIVLGLPLPMVYLIIQGEELVKVVIGSLRFRSRKWVNNLLR